MAISYSLKPFVPFFISSLVHFYYCYTMETLPKAITKVLLMPTLILAYYFVSQNVNMKIIIVYFLHWWGDIFFLWDNTYYYAVFCFWLGDIINAIEFYRKLNKFNFFHFIFALILVSLPVIYYGSFNLYKHFEHFMLYVFYGYITPLSLMVIFSIMHNLEKINKTNLFFMIGNILFIFSDLNVIWVTFAGDYNLESLVIMVTYVAAQILIINWYIVNEEGVEVIKIKKFA